MAWRDAQVSHVKNGIYGEMFVAAMIAQAAMPGTIPELIQVGLGQIPTTSRLYEAISSVLQDDQNGVPQQECAARIHQTWNEQSSYDWCHVIPNAMLVTMALLYGKGEFGPSVCMAVQEGFDTDCNGATIGSILGMLGGTAAIGSEWTAPVAGVLDTSIFGVGQIRIDDAVEKTLQDLCPGEQHSRAH